MHQINLSDVSLQNEFIRSIYYMFLHKIIIDVIIFPQNDYQPVHFFHKMTADIDE